MMPTFIFVNMLSVTAVSSAASDIQAIGIQAPKPARNRFSDCRVVIA
jgi:hypothetical protein